MQTPLYDVWQRACIHVADLVGFGLQTVEFSGASGFLAGALSGLIQNLVGLQIKLLNLNFYPISSLVSNAMSSDLSLTVHRPT